MTHDDLTHKLVHGMEMARDPRNAHVCTLDDLRVTTVYSPWLLQICRVCRHTFREHDRVLPDPQNAERMLHEDRGAGLMCFRRAQGLPWAHAVQRVPNQSIHDAFMRGLELHWQSARTAQVVEVAPRSALLGRKCPICRHTVRAGDMVVPCPCGRDCGGVFHQDPLRHLTCWDTWNRGLSPTYCAFTGARLLTTPEIDL